MSIFGLVLVSAGSAQRAIEIAAGTGGDGDAAVMRLGVLQFLRGHLSRVEAKGDDATLIEAYRSWLDIAIEMYSKGEQDLIPEFMRRSEVLTAELERADARDDDAAQFEPTANVK